MKNVHQLRTGVEAVPDAVLLFGGLSGGHFWTSLLSRLPARCAIIAYPPVNASGASAIDSQLERYAERVVEDIEGRSLGRIALVGHSVGCFSVVQIADRLGERCERAVLVNGALLQVGAWLDSPISQTVRHPALTARILRMFVLSMVPMPGPLKRAAVSHEALARAVLGGVIGSAHIGDADLRLELAASPALPSTGIGLYVNRHHIAAFHRSGATLRCRIELVNGSDDSLCPAEDVEQCRSLFASAQRVRSEIVAGGGHVLPLEAPDRVAAGVADF